MILLLGFGLRAAQSGSLGIQADEGVHWIVARQVAAGELIYADFFENRTPLVMWLTAVLFRLGDAHWWWGRWLSLAASVLSLASLITLARLVMQQVAGRSGRGTAVLAATLFALAPLPIFWSRYGMLEPVATLLSLLSLTCLLMGAKNGRWQWWLASGGLTAAAFLAKQSSIVLLPVAVLYVAGLGWELRADGGRVTRAAVGWLTGLGVVAAAVWLTFRFQGALEPFQTYLSGADRLAPLDNLADKIGLLAGWLVKRPFGLGAILGIGVMLAVPWLRVGERRRWSPLWLLLLWSGAEIGALFLPPEMAFGWGGFSHYVLSAAAALSLVTAVGVSLLWDSRWRWVSLLLGAAVLAVSGAGLAADLGEVIRPLSYPQPTQQAERQIGQAVQLLTEPHEPVLVWGNAALYGWAERPLASPFFHYPSYFNQSALLPEVETAWESTLADPNTAVLLISRMHLKDRLTPRLQAAVQRDWTPVHLFSYPYQRDIFLYLPNEAAVEGGLAAPVLFEQSILLTAVVGYQLDPHNWLVQLEWQTSAPISASLTAFTHLLLPDGSLAAQHDGVPVAGFRPTTSWGTGERIIDWHWIESPTPLTADQLQLSVGLYDPETAVRLQRIEDNEMIGDALLVPWREIAR